jgi:hypothetical protein
VLELYFYVDVCIVIELSHVVGVREKITSYSVDSTVPVRGSQNLIWLSLLPDTRRPLVGCHCTHFTSQPCPEAMNKENKYSRTGNSIHL